MIKAIAIDDEPLALAVIEVYCEKLSNLTLEKTFSSLSNAKKYLNKFPVDVVFLDVEMPKINGINFYKSLKQNVKVVFTTAYSEYAIEGFNVNAIDYLLKPFSLERFTEAVERVEKTKKYDINNIKEQTHLSLRANYKLNRIILTDILYIEAMNDYVKVHIKEGKTIIARSTMKNILSELPNSQFVRIHKSYIVPILSIRVIEKDKILLDNIVLPIGNSYKIFLKKLQ